MASNAAGGVVFPKDQQGGRSTTAVAKKIWAAALQGHNDAGARAVWAETNWRREYPRHCGAVGAASLKSAGAALAIAKQGLAAVYEAFEFERGGESKKFSEAFEQLRSGSFGTGRVEGTGALLTEPSVPYKGQSLTGAALQRRIRDMATLGSMEMSCADAIDRLVRGGGKAMDLRGKYFVLLGAGSEMGPTRTLLECGATVVAIRTRRPQAWRETCEMAEATAGTLIYPTREDGSAGVDLLTEVPEVRNWLLSVLPQGADVTVGMYIYLDSDAHVRASVAADALMAELQWKRDATLAFIGSPSVDCPVSAEMKAAMAMHRANAQCMSFLRAPMPSVTDVACEDGTVRHCLHGFSVLQGPNYALAKTIQNWRAIVGRFDGEGGNVSVIMGPPTRTASVVSNSTLKVVLDGMGYVAPCEAFDAPTASSLLALLLIADLQDPASASKKNTTVDHPWSIFEDKAVHGGGWRAGFDVEKSRSLSALLYVLGLVAPIR